MWFIASDESGVRVDLDENTLSWNMTRGGERSWIMSPDDSHDLELRTPAGVKLLSLASASKKEVAEYRSGDLHGVRILLRGFGDIDVSLAVIVAIDTVAGEVVCRIVPVDDPEKSLGEVHYPRAFELETEPGAHHIFPFRQGSLLPPDWPHEVTWDSQGQMWTHPMYMSCWGARRSGSAYLCIIETPYDGGMKFTHPAGGPTHACPKWYTSLDSLRYPRQARYALFGDVTHNELMARYREYSRSIGRLKTLETKVTEVPAVEQLRGVTIAGASTMTHVEPTSHYYKPDDPASNHRFTPFAETATHLRRFAKDYPSDRVVVHLDGWGKRGYDNLHPDILPPCPEAGGWDGFREIGEACAEQGWLFATHDNYIDFYQDAATWSDDLSLMTDSDGTIPKKEWWPGGAQSFLCPQVAEGYVRRNYRAILDHGVKLTATYIDVFAIMELYECFHPDHPLTREEDAKARARCFDYVRSLGIAMSSEEPVDYAVPHIEFCFWAPFAHGGDEHGAHPIGINAPLYNRVYHDCIVTPFLYAGEKEMDLRQHFLYALAYGGVAMINVPSSAQYGVGALERAKTLADVHRQNGFAPMERHDLLDDVGTKRLTTFADGSEVEVDLESVRFRVKGVDGMTDTWRDVP